MSEQINPKEIIKQFQKETGWSSQIIEMFFKKNKIETNNLIITVNKALKGAKEELDENPIEISESDKLRLKTLAIHKHYYENYSKLDLLRSITALSTSTNNQEIKDRLKLGEGEIIDNILKVVLGNEIKKYSLRNLEASLKNIGIKIDHNTLQTKFQNQEFQYFMIASIMRKNNTVRKQDEKEKLTSFEKWFDSVYMKRKNKNAHRKITASAGKVEADENIDKINLD